MAGLMDFFKGLVAPAQQGPVQPGAQALPQGGVLTQFLDKSKNDPEFRSGLLAMGANMLQSKSPDFGAALGGGLQAYQAKQGDIKKANTQQAVAQAKIDKEIAAVNKQNKELLGMEEYKRATTEAIKAAPPEIQAAVMPYIGPEGVIGSTKAADEVNKMLAKHQAMSTVPAGTQATIQAAADRQQTALGTVPEAVRFREQEQAARQQERLQTVPAAVEYTQGQAAQRQQAGFENQLAVEQRQPELRRAIKGAEIKAEQASEAHGQEMVLDSTLQTLDELLGNPADPKSVTGALEVIKRQTGKYPIWNTVKETVFPEGESALFQARLDKIKSNLFIIGSKAFGERHGLNKTEDEVVKNVMSSLKRTQDPMEVMRQLEIIRDISSKAKARQHALGTMEYQPPSATSTPAGNMTPEQADAIIRQAMGG